MFDGLDQTKAPSPAQIAVRVEQAGIAKAHLSSLATLGRALFAGAFVGLGTLLVAAIRTRLAPPSYGTIKLLEGLAFAVGMAPVVLTNAELFAANSLFDTAFIRGRVTLRKLLYNWAIVYLGNALGALVAALGVYLSSQYRALHGALAANILAMANAKCELGFFQAIALGMMGNALICLAIWMSFSAPTALEKVITIIFPISAAIASEFEYSIMNMHLLPLALLIKALDPIFASHITISGVAVNTTSLTVRNLLLANLLPVTIGNLVGGAGVTALAYWDIYLRPRQRREPDTGTG